MVEMETAASSALFAAKTLEDALHSADEWFIRWGDTLCPATRTSDSRGIIFSAVIPAICHIEGRPTHIDLMCGDRVTGVRPLSADEVGDAGFVVSWEIVVSISTRNAPV